MPRTIETQVFKFDELTDDAKERARDWYRGCIESDELTNYDDWEAVAAILGIEFDRRKPGNPRSEPRIWWSGFYSQGDGASFEGRYTYVKGAAKRIREYAPTDKVLHHIADDLQAAQRLNFYRLEARVSRGSGSNFYSHSGTMAVEVWDRDDEYRDIGEAEETVRQALRDFADWIYSQLEAQNDWLSSDESIDENIRANEYEFTSEGDIA